MPKGENKWNQTVTHHFSEFDLIHGTLYFLNFHVIINFRQKWPFLIIFHRILLESPLIQINDYGILNDQSVFDLIHGTLYFVNFRENINFRQKFS